MLWVSRGVRSAKREYRVVAGPAALVSNAADRVATAAAWFGAARRTLVDKLCHLVCGLVGGRFGERVSVSGIRAFGGEHGGTIVCTLLVKGLDARRWCLSHPNILP